MNECLMTHQHKNTSAIGCQTKCINMKGVNTSILKIHKVTKHSVQNKIINYYN